MPLDRNLLSRILRRTPASPLLDTTLAHRVVDRLSGGYVAVGDDVVFAPGRFRDWYSTFEPLTLAWLEAHLRPGMTAVDIGAHIGFVAARMAQLVGPTGRVVAVEPAPENLRYLRRNLRPYGDRCKVVEAAVAATSGVAELKLTGSSDSHSLYEHPLTSTSRHLLVKQVPLDDLVDRPDFVMIDVEGAELDVIAGMGRILRDMPMLLIEWMPACQLAAGRRSEELTEVLEEVGYDLLVLDDVDGVERSPDEVRALLSSNQIRPNWYANIACTKGK